MSAHLVAAGLTLAEEVTTESAKPGGVAGLVFLGMGLAAVLLWRSMNRHLRTARTNLGGQETVDGAAGSGNDTGPAQGSRP
jgi:hypothetical protein